MTIRRRGRLRSVAAVVLTTVAAVVAVGGTTAATAQAATPAKSVYFSPTEETVLPLSSLTSSASRDAFVNLRLSAWKGDTPCDAAKAHSAAVDAAGGAPIDQISGWSLGRIGALEFLINATPQQKLALRNILLIDPGNLDELSTSCDNIRQLGTVVADWLAQDPGHTLTIFAGQITGQAGHAGIQRIYFNPIRDFEKRNGVKIADQVLVCNYPQAGHRDIMNATIRQLSNPVTACPQLGGMALEGTGWRP